MASPRKLREASIGWLIKSVSQHLEDQRITFPKNFFTKIQMGLHNLPMNISSLTTCRDIWSWWHPREEPVGGMTSAGSLFSVYFTVQFSLPSLCYVNYFTAIILHSNLFPIWYQPLLPSQVILITPPPAHFTDKIRRSTSWVTCLSYMRGDGTTVFRFWVLSAILSGLAISHYCGYY